MNANRLVSIKIDETGRNNALLIMLSFCFFIMLLGCSRTMFGVYMPDDYLLASQKMPMSFYLNQGRFIQAIITGLFNYFNYNIISSSPIFTPLFFLFTSLSSSLFVLSIIPRNSSLILSCLLSGTIVSHPVFSMMAVYHLAVVCFSLCMLCVVAYIITFNEYLKNKTNRSALLPCFFLVIICGNYQPAFLIIVIYSVIKVTISENKIITISNLKALLPVALGLIVYAIIFKLTKNILGVNHWDSRAGIVDDLPSRALEILNFLPSLFYKNWWVIPTQYNIILTFSICLFLITYTFKLKKLNFRMMAMPLLFILAIIFPISILKNWDPTPRALFSISFLYSSIMLIFYNEAFSKCKAALLSVCILLGLLTSNNYLYQTEMSQKEDSLIALKAYNMIKDSNSFGKEIILVNNNSISIDFWAINGLIFFLTNENLNLSPPSDYEVNQCKSESKESRVIDHGKSLIVCLNP
ncbi:glucosyltransferase domain-containing protein [Pantoea septica]|uniref:glucosyltransferase domain-containing protein n=1 Tax=Pantoea septica TaxID=472695 RepID=UPI0023F06C1D|nr:glucosyltransferase domain-containing protein [Pantoea septica]